MKTIFLSPLSSDATYTCLYQWPDDCRVQAGDRGLVLVSQGSYYTAFFEAFPREPQTFIRGEGKNVGEAESLVWQQWQRILACPGHEMERRGYRNGVGFCKHCDLYLSHAFPPATTCLICGEPTYYSSDVDDNWYCENHIRDKPLNRWIDLDWMVARDEFEMAMWERTSQEEKDAAIAEFVECLRRRAEEKHLS